jgi:predicted O-linked N-acetylglucosamine transferase (SPINDLY family)
MRRAAALPKGRQPKSADPSVAKVNMLSAMLAEQRHDALDALLEPLLARHPHSAVLWDIRGIAASQRGDWRGAEVAFRRLVDLAPSVWTTQMKLANALDAQGDHTAAARHLEKIAALEAENPSALTACGLKHLRYRRQHEAVRCFQSALAVSPDHADAWHGLGVLSQSLMDLKNAAQCFLRAMRFAPDKPLYGVNYARVQLVLGCKEAAAEALDEVRAHAALNGNEHLLIAELLLKMGRHDAAVGHFELAAAAEPGSEDIASRFYHVRRQICDWRDFEAAQQKVAGIGVGKQAIPTFILLSAEDDPLNQLRRSALLAGSAELRAPVTPRTPAAPRAPGKLRVGYFSADMYNHATMHLISGLFRAHDRDRFALHFVSYKTKQGDMTIDRLLHPRDRLIDLSRCGDGEFVEIARGLQLDVAIDLKGMTQDNRMRLFAHRFAPVQMHFLGYPGTTGAPYIDYFVGDPVTIPPEYREGFSERILYMPHAYQPNDDRRPIPQTLGTRADHGLPEDAFVLCCFNDPYKITPLEFDIWMRVLARVPDAVLWLMGSNRFAADNLRREAEARGVDPARLVIAGKIDLQDHLARYRHADLFVDTFFVNAHTTASDALWAGLPLVTKIGRQFAARVAASLLTAAGLPELIARDEAEYETLILDLAADRDRLAGLRARLEATRFTMPLFDTKRFTRDFEAGLITVTDRAARGLPPEDIDLRWTGSGALDDGPAGLRRQHIA